MLERDFKGDAFSQRQRAITKDIRAEPEEPKRTPQVLAIAVLAPSTRRFSPWVSFKLIDRIERRRIVYLVRSFQKLSGMAGLSRCNEAANSHGKETRSAYGMLMPSIRIFGEDRLDAAVPGAVKLFQELFGRRNTARDVFLNRAQIASFVFAASVQPPTPRKSLLRQRDRRLSQVQHVVPRDPSREA